MPQRGERKMKAKEVRHWLLHGHTDADTRREIFETFFNDNSIEWEYERPTNVLERQAQDREVLSTYFLSADKREYNADAFARMFYASFLNPNFRDELGQSSVDTSDCFIFLLSIWSSPWITSYRGRKAMLKFCKEAQTPAQAHQLPATLQQFLQELPQILKTSFFVTADKHIITLTPDLREAMMRYLRGQP